MTSSVNRSGAGPNSTRPVAILCAAMLVLAAAGCGVLTPEQTPTPRRPTSPAVPATATLVLPTPPPGATLTAMVEAYRLTRTPAHQVSPTATSARADILPPKPTASPTAIRELFIDVVPEVTEPGAPIEIRGSGWRPGEEIELGFGATVEEAGAATGRGTVRADGTFSATMTVPAGWTGKDAVIVAQSRDGQLRAVTRLYVVIPTATARPPASPTAPPTATATPAFQGWRGEYFGNASLAGEPLRVRDDSLIDFAWGDGAPAPGVPADGFSVRWTRLVELLPGGYRFEIEVDDGIRVFIDDRLVLDEWIVTAPISYQFQQVLDGSATIRVEYFDAGGNAAVRFQWHYLGRYPNWRAAYYDNRFLSGTPALVRDDIAVNFDWGDGSPAAQIPPDNFSARWTRLESFAAGNHRFHARADDGIRVWVGDQIIIDEWHTSTGDADYVADVYLSSGNRDVRIEYYEAGGKAEVQVWWENLDAYAGWRGAYYANRVLSGWPAFVRDDANIDFNWSTGSPDEIGPDDFSVYWTARRGFETATYRMFAEHDDGVRVWLDEQPVIDEWYETGPATHQRDVELAGGSHTVRVEYYEATGSARIRVWWEVAPYR